MYGTNGVVVSLHQAQQNNSSNYMRRKSSRHATTKASPEKSKEDKAGKSSRRTSRPRRKHSSSASGSDSESEVISRKVVEVPVEEDVAPLKGDLKKSKITSAQPLPASPERTGRRLRRKSVSLQDEDTNSGDKPARRTRRGRGASPKKEEPLIEESEDDENEEKKGKGKSKGKNKSKLDRNPQGETELQTELVQVTAQSPQTDKIDNNDVDADSNRKEDADNIIDADNNKNDDNDVANSPEAPELSPVRTEDSNDNIVDATNEMPAVDNINEEIISKTVNEDGSMMDSEISDVNNADSQKDEITATSIEASQPILESTKTLVSWDSDVSMALISGDASQLENSVEQTDVSGEKDQSLDEEYKTKEIIQNKENANETENQSENDKGEITETGNENKLVDDHNISTESSTIKEDVKATTKEAPIKATDRKERVKIKAPAKDSSNSSNNSKELNKDVKDKSKRVRETNHEDRTHKVSKTNEENVKKSSNEVMEIPHAADKTNILETSAEKKSSRIKISLIDKKNKSDQKDSSKYDNIQVKEHVSSQKEEKESRDITKKEEEKIKPIIKVVPKITKISDNDPLLVECEKTEPAADPEKEEEIIKKPREKLRTRKWGREQIGLSTVASKAVEITLESITGIYPDLSLADESDIKLGNVSHQSRRISSAYSSDIDIPTSKERKVSIEDRPMKYESQTSESDTREEIIPQIPIDTNIIAMNRKISIVDDSASKLKPPPSPAKNDVSEVLYISNLVRPFTLKQLKELLERTGKIKEDAFWTDRIKSKCYVSYETAEEAEATRNALHGVHWPIGNGKKLMIDYATAENLETAKNPPVIVVPVKVVPPVVPPKEIQEPERVREREASSKRTKEEIEDEKERDEKRKGNSHVREWDLGKEESHKRRTSRSRSRDKGRDRGVRDRSQKRRRSRERRTRSPSEDFSKRKQKKVEEAIPQRAMDDLFRKTEATPCIYWQPLTPEEIALKQQQRMERMEEHKRRMAHTTNTPHSNRGNRGSDHPARGGPYRRRY